MTIDQTIALMRSKDFVSGPDTVVVKPKSGWTPALIVGGILVVIFGIVPMMRGTSVRQAWRESAHD